MDLNRLRWASRRGMLELDLILLPFLENCYASLDSEYQAYFQDLLLCEDQDLFNWLLNKAAPEAPEHIKIVKKIRDYAQTPR